MLYQNNIPPIGPGIYHNPTAGLISLSSDGETWTTIADKNLGATQVYNDGDELSQANCGNYYQRGNNYGFPFDGSFEKNSTQVDATNYGPYYESDIFIKLNYDWSSVQNDNLWGDITDTSEARRGPCPEGFYIPKRQEIFNLSSIMFEFGLNYSRNEYLKMPTPPRIGYHGDRGSDGGYRCSSAGIHFIDESRYFSPDGPIIAETARLTGLSIRPFYSREVIIDDSREVLFDGGNNKGIFHNSELGLIAIVSNNNTIVMANKNLGATEVYNAGDALTQENCGNLYQRGNNYGFPFTGPTKTSTVQVNATNYGPYYKRGIFVTTSSSTVDWSSVHNNNLWGGETGTLTAMKGPCQEGYHIPTIQELSSMWSIVTGLGISNEGRNLRTYLKMPFMSSIFSSAGTVPYVKDRGYYWSSTKGPWEGYSYRIWSSDDMISFQQFLDRAEGIPIRPFKNESVTPNSNRIKLF